MTLILSSTFVLFWRTATGGGGSDELTVFAHGYSRYFYGNESIWVTWFFTKYYITLSPGNVVMKLKFVFFAEP